MSQEDLILNELGHIKGSVGRIELLVTEHVREHCKTCTNAPTFRERFRTHWLAITLLGFALGALAAYDYAAVQELYKLIGQHIGK